MRIYLRNHSSHCNINDNDSLNDWHPSWYLQLSPSEHIPIRGQRRLRVRSCPGGLTPFNEPVLASTRRTSSLESDIPELRMRSNNEVSERVGWVTQELRWAKSSGCISPVIVKSMKDDWWVGEIPVNKLEIMSRAFNETTSRSWVWSIHISINIWIVHAKMTHIRN